MLTPATNAPAQPQRLIRGWRLYGAGLVVLVTTMVISHILNPHGRRGISRFSDILEFPLFGISFLLCAVAPLWSAGPWLRRFALLLPAILGYVLVLVILSFVSIFFGGMPG